MDKLSNKLRGYNEGKIKYSLLTKLHKMIKQLLLSLNFILIASLLTGMAFEIRDSVVYSFKAPAPANAPTPQSSSENKSHNQIKAINNNTELNKSSSNLTAVTNDTNSSSSPSMNNSLDPDLIDKSYKDYQDSDSEDRADKILQEAEETIREQGINFSFN